MTQPLGWRQGAAYGLVAGSTYGLVECWIGAITPAILARAVPSWSFQPTHVGLTIILVAVYGAVGALALGFAGAVASRVTSAARARHWLHALSCAAAPLALAIHLLTLEERGPSSLGSAAVSIVLAALLLLAAATGRERMLARASPAWTSVVVVGLPWLLMDAAAERSSLLKGVLALGWIALMAAMSLLAVRIRPRPLRAVGLGLLVTLPIAIWLCRIPRPPHDERVADPRGTGTNVVWIVLDTVRADHLTPYGYERASTPFLQTFADAATIYTSAYAPASWTLASHASMFTGLHPREHGADYRGAADAAGGRVGYSEPLREEFVTVAELLNASGYATQAVISNSGFMNTRFGCDQGFEYYDARPPEQVFRDVTRRYLLKSAVLKLLNRVFELHVLWKRDADEINHEVFHLLDHRDDRRPLFLFINYMDAHYPCVPPPPFDVQFPGKDPEFDWRTDYHVLRDLLWQRQRRLTERESAHLKSQYDGALAYLDDRLEELVARLRRDGLYDTSLIIVTSDHGEGLGDHDLIAHGSSLYDDQIRIPLIIKYPQQQEGREVTATVSLVDLMPTVLSIAELEAPGTLSGLDLTGELASRDGVVSELRPYWMLLKADPQRFQEQSAAIEGTYKYIESASGERELYDRAVDPGEIENLHPAMSVDRFERAMSTWREQHAARSDTEVSADVDDEMLERLRALGYVD